MKATHWFTEVHLFAIAPFLAAIVGCGGGKASSVNTTVTPTPMPTSSCSTPTVTITHTASAANAPQLVVLSRNMYPQAVCNDGTAGAYVFRPGAGAAANRWIIQLQGGGECFDQTTCSTRAATTPTLLSTASFQANPSTAFGQGGILGTTMSNNPDFYDATVVQVLYCSSDDWSGAKASSSAFNPNDPTTWNFEGRAILNSAIADLKANHNFSAAAEVMLTGDSAGGVGVFANTNPVAKLVPSGARFVSYSDAAFPSGAYDYLATGAAPNYDNPNATPNILSKRILGLPLWNGTGDPVCSAANRSRSYLTGELLQRADSSRSDYRHYHAADAGFRFRKRHQPAWHRRHSGVGLQLWQPVNVSGRVRLLSCVHDAHVGRGHKCKCVFVHPGLFRSCRIDRSRLLQQLRPIPYRRYLAPAGGWCVVQGSMFGPA